MKKIIPVVLFPCYAFSIQAQTASILPGLDNYTIPVNSKGAVIGKFIFYGMEKPGKISLAKDTSGLFKMSKTGVISLKSNVSLSPTSGDFRYGITVKEITRCR